MLVEHIAEPEIRAAGAADLAEACERGAISTDTHERANPVSHPLEQRAVMRDAEKNHRAKERQPRAILRVATCTPRDEPAHAVTHENDLVDRLRPSPNEIVEEMRERPSVRRDVQPAVVVKVN